MKPLGMTHLRPGWMNCCPKAWLDTEPGFLGTCSVSLQVTALMKATGVKITYFGAQSPSVIRLYYSFSFAPEKKKKKKLLHSAPAWKSFTV